MQKSRSPHVSNRHITEATGSALPSALLFLFLVSAFLTSLSQRAKYQLVGHQLIQDSYRAQTMALVTEQDIQLDHQHGRPLSVGTYVFNAGDVLVEEQEQGPLQLTVTLPNGFTHSHVVLLPPVVAEEQTEARNNQPLEPATEDHKQEGQKQEAYMRVLTRDEADSTDRLVDEE